MIFIAAHKFFNLINNDLYQPVLLGANKKEHLEDIYLYDSTKESIAYKNPNYSELTLLYWIWKNVEGIPFVGLCHYRRYFNFITGFDFKLNNFKKIMLDDKKYSLQNICNDSKNTQNYILNILNKYDIILPKPLKFKSTIFEHYKQHHRESDFKVMLDVIEDKYPEYKLSADVVFYMPRRVYLFNMFIAKKEFVNAYALWLFDILFEVEKRISIPEDAYQSRVFGFLSERLLNLYIYHNKLKVKKIQTFYIENQIEEL